MSEKLYAGALPGDVVCISGYLQKKTRDGRWQKHEADIGSLLSIELNGRVYTLKAANEEQAKKWVDVLNQLKIGGSDVMPTSAGNTVTSGVEIDAGAGETEWKKKVHCCWIC
ncbi:Hypothetical protein NocV09_01500260 [Nannochloropsis oceanica]